MKKRFPALVLGGILALGLLSGCGQKEAASSVSTVASESAAAANGSAQELVFVNYRDVWQKAGPSARMEKYIHLKFAMELLFRMEPSAMPMQS